MSSIPNDVINKLGAHQNQIWQTVSLTVSEACSQSINFASPLTVSTKTADLYSEIGSPMMVIQFAFAGLPENSQVVLIPQETVADLAATVLPEPVEEIDENIVSDLRATLEAIVQGICLAIGNIKNEPVVASGLSIRFQIFSFPPNLQKADEMVRVQVAVSGGELNGSAIWLMDTDTAHSILNLQIADDGDMAAFPQVGATANGANGRPVHPLEDPNGLELLMDIPLEISVELGRVKMLVKDVVELGTGSIVEIDKAAGEPVDVMVNGRLVARGEVVVIEDNFGVRLTEILNPQERLTRLGEVA
jgi:flagellar motor switch protein FliN